MIGILASYEYQLARDLVLAAVRRSVSSSLAQLIIPADISKYDVMFTISPDEKLGDSLFDWLSFKSRKLIIFGQMPSNLMHYFGLKANAWETPTDSWAKSKAALPNHFAESSARVRYQSSAKVLGVSDWSRALERFDFSSEWNNLGFGAIRADSSIWAISAPVRAREENELALVETDEGVLASYAAIFSVANSSVLWVNRKVGLIDSFEWRLIENYLSNYLYEKQPCVPVISEIPWECDAAITMRLDCDEDISTARRLWSAYQDLGVPMSLAIHTTNLKYEEDIDFLTEFCESGGKLLSHSSTHRKNWGGNYQAALAEAVDSRECIFKFTGILVDYAVSPFHQSPNYALQALCDAGYRGCIGGIISNDPEFLIARGGEIAGLPSGFIGHSQQVMMHGDCMMIGEDRLAVYKNAFDKAYETRSLFGYLDHPFSERYTYGWADENTRIQVHLDFIAYIRQQASKPIFMDEAEALDFLCMRAKIRLLHNKNGIEVCLPKINNFSFAVEYRGVLKQLDSGIILS